jgi:DNA-binding transcriptional ArsR family regulator
MGFRQAPKEGLIKPSAKLGKPFRVCPVFEIGQQDASIMNEEVTSKGHVPKVKCRAIGAASDFLKAISNPVRLSILCVLLEGERTVSDLEEMLDVHQPTLSQQLGALREAGIIEGRREARAVVYRVADPRAGQIIGHLRLLFADPGASAIWKGAQLGAPAPSEMVDS